jgi:hypothetical protein
VGQVKKRVEKKNTMPPLWGKGIYVVSVGSAFLVKRVEFKGIHKTVILISANTACPPREISGDGLESFRIKGRVTACPRRYWKIKTGPLQNTPGGPPRRFTPSPYEITSMPPKGPQRPAIEACFFRAKQTINN